MSIKYLIAALCCITFSMTTFSQTTHIDIQGHRGARGLKPENTIAAFLTALDLEVTTLELDVVITKDKKVLVSHEPWMSSEFCLDPKGNTYKDEEGKQFNIYQMTYAEVKKFDCGSIGNVRFPEQEKMKAYKPLLSDVFKTIENKIKKNKLAKIRYNIEIKSEQEVYKIFQPEPEEFSELVYMVIDKYVGWDRVTIQSFDFHVLQYWHQKHPKVTLSALVENNRSIDENLEELGFKPNIYSPEYTMLDAEKIKQLHLYNIKVIPWTVNVPEDMIQLKKWGVDGIITDYPDRAKKVL